MHVLAQHEQAAGTRIVDLPNYDADILGAPFKVILVNGVTEVIGSDGQVKVKVPNLSGLVRAVIKSRVLHPRKLQGADIRFIRRGLGLKAKTLAKQLDVTPEHFSRCEGATKTLSGSSEKIFRLLAFMASSCPDPEAVLEAAHNKKGEDQKERADPSLIYSSVAESWRDVFNLFVSMDILPIYGIGDELCFEFVICREPRNDHLNDDNVEWCKNLAA